MNEVKKKYTKIGEKYTEILFLFIKE